MRKKKIFVSKIGGAGLETPKLFKNVVNQIVPYLDAENRDTNIVVCSAIKNITRILMSIFTAKKAGDEALTKGMMQDFGLIHSNIIRELSPKRYTKVLDFFNETFSEIEDRLFNFNQYGEGENYASILQYGEIVSSKILSMYLEKNGKKNIWFDSRDYIKTKGKNKKSEIYETESRDLILENIPSLSSKSNFLITQGFIGKHYSTGQNTVLEMNGSDISAAFFAYALEASKANFFKDICGVCVGDYTMPNDISNFLPLIDHTEYGVMFRGKKFYPVHPTAIEILGRKDIPTRVCSFYYPYLYGTEIKS